MSIAEWKEVGALIGRLIASEPPFAQICIALTVAFGLLMMIEGLRASFAIRRIEPNLNKPTYAPSSTPSIATLRAAQAATRNPKLQARAVKPYRAPRPTIRRRPSAPLNAQAQSFSAASLPQVAPFEE